MPKPNLLFGQKAPCCGLLGGLSDMVEALGQQAQVEQWQMGGTNVGDVQGHFWPPRR